MKVYTSEVSQYGKKLLLLNKEVQFDKIGCAEVNDKFGKELLNYSPWYTSELVEPEIVKPKKPEPKNEDLEFEVGLLREDNEKLKLQIESRKNKYSKLEVEVEGIRKDMQKVVDERDELLKSKEGFIETTNLEIEDWKHRFKLMELSPAKLKETCAKMGVEEKEYKELNSKKKLIEIIIKASK